MNFLMNFSVIPSDKFKKEVKRIIKKFPSLKHELAKLSTALAKKPEAGTPLGHNTRETHTNLTFLGTSKNYHSGTPLSLEGQAKVEVPGEDFKGLDLGGAVRAVFGVEVHFKIGFN